VAASNIFRESLNRLRRNIDQNRSQIGPLERIILEGVTFPDQTGFEIRADALTKDGAVARTSNYSSTSLTQQYRTQMVSLFR
jgi:phage protein U